MRKKYIRPDLLIETFTLTQSIAINCSPESGVYDGPNGYDENIGKPLLHDITNCAFAFGMDPANPDFTLFLDSNSACVDNEVAGVSIDSADDFKNSDLLEQYCYQAPTDMNSVFDS